MKKWLMILLAAILMMSFSVAYATEIDLTGMSAEELHALIERAEIELSKLSPASSATLTEGAVMYEDEIIRVTYNGKIEIDDLMGTLDISVIVENLSDGNQMITFTNASCNGWAVMDTVTEVPAGKKSKTELIFWDAVESAELESADDVKEIECSVYCINSDTYEMTKASDPVVWVFSE